MELSTSVCVKAGLFSHPSSLTCPKDILKFSIITTQSRRNWRSRTSLLRISELQRPQKSIVLAMATGKLQEALPPVLDSTSEPPSIFDGTTRLYICYKCPFAQRVWIARNYKGLQDTIKLVPIDLQNRPSWYKEKVYPKNKVPSLEHNNEVRGESLDLIKYINENFEGLPLLPDVDIAYAPFIERYEPFLADVWKYDIAAGRPKLASWIEEINKIEAYIQTKNDPKVLVEGYKQRYEEISLSTVLSWLLQENSKRKEFTEAVD
ncbi:protein IN2-1 homolog B-like isoform X4 [Aristolochia californica]|uniref:protein IN2-1 homolog B-like isoform X4 n=1 Tax=Aristolochia californica TaxID=171875 RepID=UPI0035DCE617